MIKQTSYVQSLVLIQGAFWGLMAALVAGLIRLVMVLVYKTDGKCGDDDDAPAILDMHYMYFALLLCIITFAVTTVISLLTERPHPKHVRLACDTHAVRSQINTSCICLF